MPWKVSTVMEQKKEFVCLAKQEGANIRELCRRYNISPTTGYKWIAKEQKDGEAGLLEQSRRPAVSPERSAQVIEEKILTVRRAHPKWGARKIKRYLEDRGTQDMPVASTVHAILVRHGMIPVQASNASQAWKRFEHPLPNDLWQMDFKGHFAAGNHRCHPLTVLDDHSRYVVCLSALGNERFDTTQQQLIEVFKRYGLPWRMTMDNGSPWGEPGRYTRFELWLMRLGIKVSHSRPYHPQTQGKDERFHRTLKAEVLQDQSFRDLQHAQQAFDRWLPIYNQQRPHDALALATPASRYTSSARKYPDLLPALEYDVGDQVRKVQGKGELFYKGATYVIGQAFFGQSVGLRRTLDEDVMDVYFGIHHVAKIDVKEQSVLIQK